MQPEPVNPSSHSSWHVRPYKCAALSKISETNFHNGAFNLFNLFILREKVLLRSQFRSDKIRLLCRRVLSALSHTSNHWRSLCRTSICRILAHRSPRRGRVVNHNCRQKDYRERRCSYRITSSLSRKSPIRILENRTWKMLEKLWLIIGWILSIVMTHKNRKQSRCIRVNNHKNRRYDDIQPCSCIHTVRCNYVRGIHGSIL